MASNYPKVQYGSQGETVRQLQRALNQAGYSLDVDGGFGTKTKAAVIDYQRKNGLSVDGVVGTETWGSLNKAQTKTTVKTNTAPANTSLYKAYDPSTNKAYTNAVAALEAAKKNAPKYASTYDGQLKDLYEQIVNRDKFAYDINADALYKQYADQYMQKGELAMMDAVGQAAAMTGGYGSSYGQAVGQQTYNAYLQQLNDIVPELYDRAYGQYQDEGDKMLQQYEMLGDLRDDEYSKYNDAYSKWLAERDYAQGNADTAYERGYNQWKAALDQANADRQYAESVRQYNESMAEQKRQFDAQMAYKATAARYSGSGGGGGSSVTKNGTAKKATYTIGELADATAAGMSKRQIEETLKARGIDVNDPAVQADIKWALSK